MLASQPFHPRETRMRLSYCVLHQDKSILRLTKLQETAILKLGGRGIQGEAISEE